jgi:voltage-gated potassium channel
MNPFRRLLPIVLVLLAVLVVGVAGFMSIEGWGFLESLYMVVITLLTIGFQEVHPLSAQGRIFTMLIAVVGAGTAVFAAGKAAEIIIEGEVHGYRMRRRMEQHIQDLKDHYIIAGFGRVGHQVAEDFHDAGLPYVVIDTKPETVNELQPKGVPHIVGDPTLDEVLEEAGILRAKGLVACSDSDVSNVYVTLSARALNTGLYIVARASQRETEKKLKMAGADRVVSPYFISGRRMAAMVTRPVTSDFLDTVSHGGELEFRLHEIPVPARSSLAGRTIAESQIRTRCGAMVLAIHKLGGTLELQPQASSTIRAGDTLVVIGTTGQIEALIKLMM